MRRRKIDAVITVGAGDKMFWGRLAARLAGVPVVASALHSTGMPDRVQLLNRLLAPITDAFIAVAETHGQYLAAHEGCPASRICVVPNGIDVAKFRPSWPDRALQEQLGLTPETPVVGILAALRPEKNHELFLQAAALVHRQLPEARFLIVGDGPRLMDLKVLANNLAISDAVHFLGTRADVPDVLSLCNVIALTSHMEANPVSILEAMAVEKPVVATNVGSVGASVHDGENGFLVPAGSAEEVARRVLELLRDRDRAAAMGRAGREFVIAHGSVDRMVRGYENLISEIYSAKSTRQRPWTAGKSDQHPPGSVGLGLKQSAR